MTNEAVISYFKQEVSANRESYLQKRILRYRAGGKRRWFMAARQKNAYVWQQGRFDADVEFWQQSLSDPNVVKPVKDGECLRLFLSTPDDFQFFHDSATEKLQASEWLGGSPEEEMEEEVEVADAQ